MPANYTARETTDSDGKRRVDLSYAYPDGDERLVCALTSWAFAHGVWRHILRAMLDRGDTVSVYDKDGNLTAIHCGRASDLDDMEEPYISGGEDRLHLKESLGGQYYE